MRSRIRDGRALATKFTVQAADQVAMPYRVVPHGHDECCAQATSRLVLHPNSVKSLSAIVVTTSYYGECPGDRVKIYVISKDVGELPSLKYFPDVKDQKPN